MPYKPPPKENPHIPKYIKDAPWYSADDSKGSDDYLAHHRNKDTPTDNSAPRTGLGIRDEFIPSTKSVHNSSRRKLIPKGQCSNCGGEHDKRDCLEKPKRTSNRAISIKEQGKGKRNEEVDYDGKRDRWYGYNVEDFNKRLVDWETKNSQGETDGDAKEYDRDEEIELKELGLWDEVLQGDSIKIEGEKTVRLREDKAVYLKDVRNETITYDPKSRAIRDDTTGYYNEKNLFVKHLTGEARRFEDTKKFAWDEKKKGLIDDNVVANPTLADRKIRDETESDLLKKQKLRKKLMDRYSYQENEEEEDSIEDNGDIINRKGFEESTRSRYAEDIFPKNHTSVWGSYYVNGKWGYRCCKSTSRNSLCK